MKICTSLNFSAYSREGELSLCDSLSVCVDAGFDLIEIDLSRGVGERALAADNWEDEIKLIRNEAERAGARIVSVHAPHNPRLYMPEGAPSEAQRAEFDKLLVRSATAARLLGADILVVHPVDNLIDAEYEREVNMATNIAYLSEVCKEAKKQGIRIAVENVYYSSVYRLRRRFGESAEEVAALADAIGAGICWNCGHAHPVTMDQARAIEKLGNRIILFHLSDSRGHTDAGLPPMIGNGNIKWEAIMPAISRIGFEGYAMMQADQYINNMPRVIQADAASLAKTMCTRLEELYNKAN